jgi:dihydrofolate reductase
METIAADSSVTVRPVTVDGAGQHPSDEFARAVPSSLATTREGTAMGKIGVHEFISLDGVIESPAWTADYEWDPRMGDAIGHLIATSEAILLGRKTFEMFATAWPQRTAEDDPGAPFFNNTMKYVVSSTLKDPSWQNTTVLGGYDPQAIRDLKDKVSGGLYVSGSAQLVQGLLADGLVDELHLFVYPLTLGAGQRLFADGSAHRLSLVASETYNNGVLHLNYAQG